MQSPDQARRIAESLVERGISSGATAGDALYAGNRSSSVQMRLGELEDVSRSEGEEMGFDFSSASVRRPSPLLTSRRKRSESLSTVAWRWRAKRPTMPMPDWLRRSCSSPASPPSWIPSTAGSPIRRNCARVPWPRSKRPWPFPGVTNSSGASAGASKSSIALATSGGFSGSYRSTGYSCGVSVIAGEGSAMQRGHRSHSTRHLDDLEEPDEIGRDAGERAVARLNPTRPKAGRYPILFDARVSATLLGCLSGAINGSSVASKTSFLQDKLGQQIFGKGVTIVDDPFRPRGLRSRPFDGEGVRVARLRLVEDGVLTSWMATSAAARQLGILPTGHAARGAGGAPGASPSNLFIEPGRRSLEELLAAFPKRSLSPR